MKLRASAILVASRAHGETAVITQLLTEDHGLVAAYVAGGRGRQLRPVVMPGNLVSAEISARTESQLPFARLELLASRGPWLAEPLPAAAIAWSTALTACALPERYPYPSIYAALEGLLEAICHAPSARGWASALVGYEALVLREQGYGGRVERPEGDMGAVLAVMDALGPPIEHYLLAGTRGDVMAARTRLRDLLERIR